MATSTSIENLRACWRKFAAARAGNVVLTFALTSVPVFGLVGAAIDYSRANSAKAAMQAAVDATALMLSKQASGLTDAERAQKAQDYFNALFNRTEVTNIVITPVYTTTDSTQLVITGTGRVPTTVAKVIGVQQLNIGVSSTIRWGSTRLRVALVLDNTGSMASSNKMTSLKTATKSLLTQLRNAAGQNGDVYVSIIPFNKDVNVDKANLNQTWLRWDLWDAANSSSSTFSGSICFLGMLWQVSGSSPSNASVSYGGSCSTPAPGICFQGTMRNWNGTQFVSGASCANHTPWNGCVTDRDQDYDTRNTAPATATPGTLFPTEQYDKCPAAMMGLTYDWTALNNKIDEMLPDGNTNQAIGLQWGFQSLTSAPFTIPAMDAHYTYRQVVILLTDGLNTQNRWTTDQATIDARQRITCDNAKAAGMVLYMIQVNTDTDPTSTMLQQCASPDTVEPKGPKFFLLTSASEIETTFNQIGTGLRNLRVAR
jgi:Flp pilus assembly protein TadG